MKALLLVGLAMTLAGCEAPPRDIADFATDPEAAEQVTAECDAGRATRECDAAREGLAEARRRARMAAYEQAF